jgi:hypothetical protein
MIIPFAGLRPVAGVPAPPTYSNRSVAIVWQPVGCVKRAVEACDGAATVTLIRTATNTTERSIKSARQLVIT